MKLMCCGSGREVKMEVTLAPSVAEAVKEFLRINESDGKPLHIGEPGKRDAATMKRTVEGYGEHEPLPEPWWLVAK